MSSKIIFALLKVEIQRAIGSAFTGRHYPPSKRVVWESDTRTHAANYKELENKKEERNTKYSMEAMEEGRRNPLTGGCACSTELPSAHRRAHPPTQTQRKFSSQHRTNR